MAKDKSRMSEKILKLTLEIIYLLTGENFTAIKTETGRLSISQDPVSEPPSYSLKHDKKNKKILQLTNKIIELLTVEEQEYLDGHMDLYKDVVEKHQTIKSPGGSSKRKPPKRRPRPHYSHSYAEDKHSFPQDHKNESLSDFQIVIVEDNIKKESEELRVIIKEEEIPTDISTDGHESRHSMEAHVISSPDCERDDDDFTVERPRRKPKSVNTRPVFQVQKVVTVRGVFQGMDSSLQQ
ncbi:uncharacterized protein LOC121005404 isoform X3 [Bufo bufo]|uniref:uncharacterized protein LOC121005404 isoform X3 n=1 Tax=Bufo bufo TaxID=8384 RepID=UPI001ABEBCEE|nr:uncharacterized protein LOC121005404 isoform X3 [Bufo bufo]